MSAQVILGKAMFTIRGADHLQVEGDLVQIQRSGPTGFETVAVAGEDMLVTIEPAERAKIEIAEKAEKPEKATTDVFHWHPVGEPLD
jgi:hypothetical protein